MAENCISIAELGLGEADLERYSRQLILPGWSVAFQNDLATRSVAIDSKLPLAALYLQAAGFGTVSEGDTTDYCITTESTPRNKASVTVCWNGGYAELYAGSGKVSSTPILPCAHTSTTTLYGHTAATVLLSYLLDISKQP